MPKRSTRRRFDEPRIGVTQLMVEAEARELGREIDVYLVQSLTELKQTTEKRSQMYREADEQLSALVGRLPERERLAVMSMLSRDLHLVLAVYLDFLKGREPEGPVPIVAPPAPVLPFSNWLFEL
jgi:hypothetical protein